MAFLSLQNFTQPAGILTQLKTSPAYAEHK